MSSHPQWLASAAVLASLCFGLVSAGISIEPCDHAARKSPSDFEPIHYDIKLEPFLSDNKYAANVSLYFGVNGPRVNVFGKILKQICNANKDKNNPKCKDQRPQNEIVVHADKSLDISQVTVRELGSRRSEVNVNKGKEVRVVSVCRSAEQQLLFVTVEKNLQPGSYGVVSFEFSASIRNDMRGIYKSTYKEDGAVKEILATQFYPVDTRLAFPCIDELAPKATVSLKLIHADDLTAVSSAPSELVRSKHGTQFRKTRPIPINLFAFVLGEFAITERYTDSGVNVRVYSAPSRRRATQFALDTAVRAIQWMERYIGLGYPERQFSVVSIPDQDKGSTGNWGLATVRDLFALIDDNTRPDHDFIVGLHIVKVVLQQWYGTIISPATWTDTWVTEGLLCQKTFQVTEILFPNFEMDILVRLGILDTVFATPTARAVGLSGSESPRVLYGSFHPLEWTKNGVIMHMVRDMVGRERADQGLRNLVRSNWEGVVTVDKAISAIQKHQETIIKPFVTSWLQSPGYPLVQVEHVDDQIQLTAALYRGGPAAGQNQDYIDVPAQVLFRDEANNLTSVADIIISAEEQPTIVDAPHWFDLSQPGHWFKLNPRPVPFSTYYLTKYGEKIASKIREAIANRTMEALDRIHILDDSIHMFKNGIMEPEKYVEVVGAFASENDHRVLLALTKAFIYGRQTTASVKNPFVASILTTGGLDALLAAKTITQWRSKDVISRIAISKGFTPMIGDAVAKFDAGADVAVVMQSPVYEAVVKSGSEAQKEKLVRLLETSTSYNHQLRLARALVKSDEEQILERVFQAVKQTNFKAEVALSIAQLMKLTPAGAAVVDRHQGDVGQWSAAPKPLVQTPAEP